VGTGATATIEATAAGSGIAATTAAAEAATASTAAQSQEVLAGVTAGAACGQQRSAYRHGAAIAGENDVAAPTAGCAKAATGTTTAAAAGSIDFAGNRNIAVVSNYYDVSAGSAHAA